MTSAYQPSPKPFPYDLLSIHPGALVGGAEQIVADLVPQIAALDEVLSYGLTRSNRPVPVVHLFLRIAPDAAASVVEHVEDLLESSLHDEPRFAMYPLVECSSSPPATSGSPRAVQFTPGAAVTPQLLLSQDLQLERVHAQLAAILLGLVRDEGWDRKSIAPTLLQWVLEACSDVRSQQIAAYEIMRSILRSHPEREQIIRQLRRNASRLVKAGVPIRLEGAARSALYRALDPCRDGIRLALSSHAQSLPGAALASAWEGLVACLGFEGIEAAYLACLLSSACESDA